MKHWLCVALLLLTGCGSTEWVQEKIGAGPTPEEKAAAQEERVRKIKVADDLVRGWADRLEERKSESGGFEHYQSFVDVDPWGKNLTVSYEQVGLEEILTVRSAGPDCKYETEDDIVHSRKMQNWMGWAFGDGSVISLVLIWVVCGGLTYLACRGWHARKKNEPHPMEVFACIVLAPIALAVYCVMFLVSVILSVAGDGPGIDIDIGGGGGIDLDLDL